MRIIDRIDKLLKKKGATAKELAEAIGVSTSNISEWRKDRAKPTAEVIVKIADYFDVTTDYLLGRVKHKHDIILEGDDLPEELRGLGIGIETIREVANSGLTPKQIRYALKAYKVLEEVYGDDKNGDADKE